MLRSIIIRRGNFDKDSITTDTISSTQSIMNSIDTGLPRDEVMESIALPQQQQGSFTRQMLRSFQQFHVNDSDNHDSSNGTKEYDAVKTDAMSLIKDELELYITEIALLYNENPFHNFEHACHVVMSTRKLLSRLVQSCSGDPNAINDTAYGITSDPLTQFAVVFSALVHDVGHPGVSNNQLQKEKSPIGIKYHYKSTTEQNSVTLAWNLLMQPKFHHLCFAIMSNNECECKRFRQLLVNSVMATDLFDAELKLFRENRWNRAFDNPASVETSPTLTSSFQDLDGQQQKAIKSEQQLQMNPQLLHRKRCILNNNKSNEESNRRATIVIELILQASDVSISEMESTFVT
jgi:3'5'-cyclic nucleotide phosphodiesterase